MTREQLGAAYKDRWINAPTPLSFKNLDMQLKSTKHPEKGVVFLFVADNDLSKELAAVNVNMKSFAVRKKNGQWLFSEDTDDVDFVMAELTGLTVAEYRRQRDEKHKASIEKLNRI